jgi:HTH-type transcriptional regulator/antitoxin HigA
VATKKRPRRTTATGKTKSNGRGNAPEKLPIHPGYLALIEVHPLRPIRSGRELDVAIEVLDQLLARAASLQPEEEDYLECLSHEIERYEEEAIPMPEVSGADMLRHLMDARGLNLAELAKETGIVPSTLSSILNGKRKMNLRHIQTLAAHFGVVPSVFMD